MTWMTWPARRRTLGLVLSGAAAGCSRFLAKFGKQNLRGAKIVAFMVIICDNLFVGSCRWVNEPTYNYRALL